jgi:PAS domain S-box-containing protein
MADGPGKRRGVNKGEASASADLPPLPLQLPPAMFTGPGLMALADLLPVMTAFVDRDLVYRFMNKPLAEWLARPRREIIGRHMREVLGEAAFAEREPLLAAALAGERQFFAATFPQPVHGLVTAQSDYVPWLNPATGAVDGVVMVITDISEQRATELALRESEARFRRIANSAPVMMWVTRLDRVRDFVNDAYVEFVAGPPKGSDAEREQVRTIDWRTRIHPDDVDRLVAESISGEASLEPFTLEGRYLRADGEYRWLRSVSQPRFNADGELAGFIGVASDITLAKEAELELRRQVDEQTAQLAVSEARFRAIFDTVLEVIVLLEPDGTIIEMNQTKASWRDPDPRRAVGLKVWDSPTLKNYPQHIALMKQAVAGAARGEPFRTEVRMEREGAPTAYLDYSIAPIRDGSGKVVYLLTEARDITELKAAQEQLRQSQKMEALGQLTGGIAHDFNNLLTVVVGGLDLIAKRVEDPKLKQYADNALAAAERGARLTGQLLAFSRVQRLEVRPTFVAPLIQNMRPLLRNVLGPGIEKRFDLDKAAMPVIADPTQLEVAVLNLAINARDAMPGGGTLTFSSRALTIDAGEGDLAPGDYIELTITDTGDGMPPEIAERAFEPFFTTKEVGKGTGLGLDISRRIIVERHGGEISLEPRAGGGALVRVRVPLRAAEG